ncbi:hypothetical protein DCAR_0312531 [Daucus carota subsp. sativus]|uniref:Uncharacterized protein n=1 Tax=Daucus carota subsp. sativus TaxID=79200 RepID=A0AAF0WSF0_DAUCS|nr:hypothetical protein DCAR_0312531 [Daucus carota subsp. sativus]
MVERSLCMREVQGSIPCISIFYASTIVGNNQFEKSYSWKREGSL